MKKALDDNADPERREIVCDRSILSVAAVKSTMLSPLVKALRRRGLERSAPPQPQNVIACTAVDDVGAGVAEDCLREGVAGEVHRADAGAVCCVSDSISCPAVRV